MPDEILPDLQACVLCEDVRQEASGQQTLVGIIGVIPSPVWPPEHSRSQHTSAFGWGETKDSVEGQDG